MRGPGTGNYLRVPVTFLVLATVYLVVDGAALLPS
jgi:hypothetical protein